MKRKGDAELVLRFIALADRMGSYKPPLRQFLNEYMREFREDAEHVAPFILDRARSLKELGYIKKLPGRDIFDYSLLEQVIAEEPALYQSLKLRYS